MSAIGLVMHRVNANGQSVIETIILKETKIKYELKLLIFKTKIVAYQISKLLYFVINLYFVNYDKKTSTWLMRWVWVL